MALVYFYSHYFFASNTAPVSAMYAPFLVVAVAAGAPEMLSALVLAFFSNLFSSMTHYGTGPAPVYFGSGYVEMGDWWKSGFIVSLVNIVIWLGIGGRGGRSSGFCRRTTALSEVGETGIINMPDDAAKRKAWVDRSAFFLVRRLLLNVWRVDRRHLQHH